jgi:hypothetical protein
MATDWQQKLKEKVEKLKVVNFLSTAKTLVAVRLKAKS